VPSDGIYTCRWIAAHPTAATLAGVSCRADMVNPGSDYTPSDVLVATRAMGPDAIDASGCQYVPPQPQAIGTNVYAQSTAEYSATWAWGVVYPSAQHGPYYWYLKHTDGSNQAWNYSGGADGSIGVPGNVYYWKVQNKASWPQEWEVCYGQH
jgi:hypothetical protein